MNRYLLSLNRDGSLTWYLRSKKDTLSAYFSPEDSGFWSITNNFGSSTVNPCFGKQTARTGQENNIDIANRTITLLGDDEFGINTLLTSVLAVQPFAVQEHDDVRVLLY